MKEFILGDCMAGMRDFPANFFDLAIVDPIYMQGFSTATWTDKGLAPQREYKTKTKTLEVKTTPEYFTELQRVSKNQIIWGGNHYILPISRGWIVWDKQNGVDNYFSDCELAWTSFDRILKKFTFRWQGMLQVNMKDKEHRIHPTQKPVQLYKWLLKNYAQPGFKILDTHVGSASSLVAFEDFDCEYVGYEIDPSYYKTAMERLINRRNSPTIFDQ